MSRIARLAALARLGALLLLAQAGPAAAQASTSAPWVELALVGGGRAGSGTDDSLLGGGSALVGWRWDWFRIGATASVYGSRSLQGLGVDAGLALSGDFVSLALDSTLTVAAFARLELLARGAPNLGRWGFVPLASVGLRAFGLSVALAGGPEVGLALGSPGGGAGVGAVGFTAEVRLGVELVELVGLGARLGEQATPPPR